MNELSLFNNLFGDVFGETLPDFTLKTASVPKVDVKENKDSYSLEMELPGKTEKDVNLELDHNVLTISSTKEDVKEEKSKDKESEKWLLRERHTSSFSRRFTLPEDVDGENVKATFKNGILNVNLPRKALASPKRIEIAAV